MSSVIRIEGPNSSGGQPLYGTLPFPHQQQNMQRGHQQQQMQFYSTLPTKPERRVQFADGVRPEPPTYGQLPTNRPVPTEPPTYGQLPTTRPAPTNLSRPPPQGFQLGQAIPMSSNQMQQNPYSAQQDPYSMNGPRPAAYAMPLNSSSTLNIQLLIQQGIRNMQMGANGPNPNNQNQPPNVNGAPIMTNQAQSSGVSTVNIQRQTSETSSNTSTGSNNKINTQAEVYAQIEPKQSSMTSTSSTSTTELATDTTDAPPPPVPPVQRLSSTTSTSTCSTQTDMTEDEGTQSSPPQAPPPPPMPTRSYPPPDYGSDSGKGSMAPEIIDDIRSLQSGSSGGERSDLSLDFMPNGTEASSFEFGDGDNIRPPTKQKPCRVSMVVTPGAALMIKMTFPNEDHCDDPAVLDLFADITEVNLTGKQLNKLKVRDGKPCSDDIQELCEKLGAQMELSEGIFRRYDETSHCHVANYMYEIVKTRGNCTVGKTGVVICLKKRNKYAPVDAFCEQLCEHIAIHKPRWVGKVDLAKLNKQNQHVVHHLSEMGRKGFLLPQTFQFDPTITVAEAAKRSFVELLDFVHFYY